MKRSILILILAAIATQVNAGTVPNDNTVMVDSFRVQSNGTRFAVRVTGETLTQNPANCSSSASGRAFYVVYPDNDLARSATGYDQMFATVVAAKYNNTPLTVWISDEGCSGNLPIVELIRAE